MWILNWRNSSTIHNHNTTISTNPITYTIPKSNATSFLSVGPVHRILLTTKRKWKVARAEPQRLICKKDSCSKTWKLSNSSLDLKGEIICSMRTNPILVLQSLRKSIQTFYRLLTNRKWPTRITRTATSTPLRCTRICNNQNGSLWQQESLM